MWRRWYWFNCGIFVEIEIFTELVIFVVVSTTLRRSLIALLTRAWVRGSARSDGA
jgi:hypothetical protein